MELPDRVDVVVVGGGLAGCAAAGFLAREGVDVVLLEGGQSLAADAGIGVLPLGLAEPADRLAESLGEDAARELYQFCVEDIALLRSAGAVEETGGIWTASDAREAEALGKAALACTRLGIRVETRGDDLFFPDEASFRPDAAVEGLLGGARAVVGADVSRLVQGEGVEVGSHRVRCEAVVLAGGWRMAELDPWFEHKILPVRAQALAVAGPPALGSGRTGWGWTSWREEAGELRISGCRWTAPNLEIGETDPIPTDAVQGRLEAFAARVALGCAVTRRWAWIEAHGCDNLPIVGPLPGLPTWVALTGFGATGPSLAVRAGRAVADGLLGRAPRIPAFFAASRF
jgi:glycine/D-amino acid oxidase-like deaminating enzyme